MEGTWGPLQAAGNSEPGPDGRPSRLWDLRDSGWSLKSWQGGTCPRKTGEREGREGGRRREEAGKGGKWRGQEGRSDALKDRAWERTGVWVWQNLANIHKSKVIMKSPYPLHDDQPWSPTLATRRPLQGKSGVHRVDSGWRCEEIGGWCRDIHPTGCSVSTYCVAASLLARATGQKPLPALVGITLRQKDDGRTDKRKIWCPGWEVQ